jgi:hypothetical protein
MSNPKASGAFTKNSRHFRRTFSQFAGIAKRWQIGVANSFLRMSDEISMKRS